MTESAGVLQTAFVLTALLLCSGSTALAEDLDRDVIFQVSTIDALLQGVYDGVMTIGELRPYGDLGIGTLDGLDGELILIDGEFFQVRADGKVYTVNDSKTVPAASVTYFNTDIQIPVQGKMNFSDLCSRLDRMLPSKNLFYALRIDGKFPLIKARAYPRQSRPYPRMADLNQSVFVLENVSGTIAGFYVPEYCRGIGVTGYHMHMISDDRIAGGHILDLLLENCTVKADVTRGFAMQLPESGDFVKTDLTGDLTEELKEIEN